MHYNLQLVRLTQHTQVLLILVSVSGMLQGTAATQNTTISAASTSTSKWLHLLPRQNGFMAAQALNSGGCSFATHFFLLLLHLMWYSNYTKHKHFVMSASVHLVAHEEAC